MLGCVLAAYLTWLEMQVRQRLADLQWELPARVYARPIDLYAGAALSAADLERHLRRAGYQRQESIGIPGDYARSGDRISAYLREFAYWDGVEPPRLLEVRFAGRRIISLRDTRSGEPAALQRVDPPLVGRIVPRSNENRVFVPASGIPPALRDAIVAVEDRQFFRHRGVDLRGILRALWVNLRAGEVEQGGSTLTQQLVKNLFLSPDRTLARKLNEAAMAVLVEWHLDKEQILWAYVNEVYLGQQGATAVHGFGTAAEYYFGRPLGELRLHQLALLVALVRGASHYDPHRHPERARERRDLVLRLMQDGGFLSAAEGDAASRRGLDIVGKPTWSRERHPAFMDLVRRDLRELYSVQQLASTGLRIFTSLDLDAQEAVDAGIEQVLKRIEARRKIKPGSLQAAALVIDYTTGEVVAMAGGRGAGAGDFNRALTARRPIGSLVKPFVYLEALGQGNRFNLLTPLDDSPFELKLDDGSLWKPENYDQRQHGTVTMLEALSRSYNVATVRLGMELGPVRIMKLLQRSGLRYAPKPLPSTLLGAIELSPLEVGQVYQTLANGGFSIPLSTIREAVAVNGTGLTRHELSMSQSFEPGPAFLIAHALAEATTGGTGKALPGLLGQSGHFPGKTGTTNDLRDSWFAGYGDRYLGVVWAGLDSNNSMGLTGAAGAMPVWAETMRRLGVEPWPGVPPPDVRWMRASAVPIGGACADLGYIPYIGAPVGVLSGCNGG
ncbi:MAG: penicillin-binding protein 1B [Gammaproteobacteria bacterium]|nr:penicillin-binding protein 1B [Gammaproteobacteria bacterium]